MSDKNEGVEIKFHPGQVVATPGAVELLRSSLFTFLDFLARHLSGDWGDVDEHDQAANDAAVDAGERILSAYEYEGQKFWVVTEADRSVTTFLKPEEY